MTRFAPRLMILLLCATALTACATDRNVARETGGKTAEDIEKAKIADLSKAPSDLDSSVRQAQLLRTQGQYEQAIKILSQLMLVASDDAQVVGEYGKTLTEKGNASEAVQFLSRATELQSNDWTTYSAMGVAYDQLGDQASARIAYDHALALKPAEPSILNNYALSRMLANDPNMARQLIARAQTAGGASDPKIARNIELVNELAPASANSSPLASSVQKPAPVASVATHPAPQQQAVVIPAPPVSTVQPTGAPHPLMAQQTQVSAPHPTPQAANTVVMQRVPVDPLAGPVKTAAHAPRPAAPVADAVIKDAPAKVAAANPVLTVAKTTPAKASDAVETKVAGAKPADAVAAKVAVAKAAPAKASAAVDTKVVTAKPADTAAAKVATAKTAPAKASDAVDAKVAAVKPTDAAAKGAIAKTTPAKPAGTVDAKVATAKPTTTKPADANTADTKLAAAKPTTPVKTADAGKTDAKPAPVKVAAAKPEASPVKTAKNAVPELRMTADARSP